MFVDVATPPRPPGYAVDSRGPGEVTWPEHFARLCGHPDRVTVFKQGLFTGHSGEMDRPGSLLVHRWGLPRSFGHCLLRKDLKTLVATAGGTKGVHMPIGAGLGN